MLAAMTRRSARWLLLTLAVGLLAPSCKRKNETEEAPLEEVSDVPAAVMKCEAGISKAMASTELQSALAVYYRECADLYTKPECREAWRAAAAAPDEKRASIAEQCKKVYCPDFASRSLEMCGNGFDTGGSGLDRAWGPFFGAVLEQEGAETLQGPLFTLFVHLAELRMKAAPSAAASVTAPPASSASAAAPASAAPPSAASAAPSGKAAPAASSPAPRPAAPKPAAH